MRLGAPSLCDALLFSSSIFCGCSVSHTQHAFSRCIQGSRHGVDFPSRRTTLNNVYLLGSRSSRLLLIHHCPALSHSRHVLLQQLGSTSQITCRKPAAVRRDDAVFEAKERVVFWKGFRICDAAPLITLWLRCFIQEGRRRRETYSREAAPIRRVPALSSSSPGPPLADRACSNESVQTVVPLPTVIKMN